MTVHALLLLSEILRPTAFILIKRVAFLVLFICRISSSTIVTTASSKSVINHLLRSKPLTQSYYALRHGQSLANVANIISSDPTIATVQHGLSDMGKEQARVAGESFATEYNNSNENVNQGVAIFSSDFTRAKETALIFAKELSRSNIQLYKGNVILEPRLRERYFGELNGGPDIRYHDVWDIDVEDSNHDQFGVESANSVLERTTGLITELDEECNNAAGEEPWKCILVAHGDVLQIMQTGFLKHEDASRHRRLEHLETATLRELILGSTHHLP